jgi:hypothetical protein
MCVMMCVDAGKLKQKIVGKCASSQQVCMRNHARGGTCAHSCKLTHTSARRYYGSVCACLPCALCIHE